MLRVVSTLLIFLLSSSVGDSRGIPLGNKSPEFSLQDSAGTTFSLANLKGKIIVIAFWKLDQERSVQILVNLQSIYAELNDQNVEILAISSAKNNLEQINNLRQSKQITFPLLLDREEKVYGDYQVLVMPCVYIVDKEGNINYYYAGYRDDFPTQISGRIGVLLGKKTIEQLESELHPTQKPEISETEDKALRHLKAGDRLLEKGMKKDAMLQYQEAGQIQPDLFLVHLRLGEIYLDQKMIQEAKEAFTKAVSLKPESSQAYNGLGEVLFLQEQPDKAMETLQIALKLNPKLARAHYNMGRIYEKQNKIQDALNEYKIALKILLEME